MVVTKTRKNMRGDEAQPNEMLATKGLLVGGETIGCCRKEGWTLVAVGGASQEVVRQGGKEKENRKEKREKIGRAHV